MSHLHLSIGLHPGVVWQATPPSEVLQRQAPLHLQKEGHFTLKGTPCQVGPVCKLAKLNQRWEIAQGWTVRCLQSMCAAFKSIFGWPATQAAAVARPLSPERWS